ncbi:bifunctional ADP-dependent NAD(P)H-hydrate dehydratase/NAD(P)H-hydrate epimerase [Desulfatitalea tepidiphila]|uniref:bifunctional ADP-dependent NAD(P)H-hydrate dehydratase/NAD(P)H-hydrate epimerase n=1 Tax=Desulfatitalea tepidiphila TaxID=1185843 RepID=UPI0006B5EFE5|nr:bifunctional ADP-dependent NAD(P)H-hydrate dehydratase/NAD(P)H-hydrate epimerase [Desulfatitalea tepidiphila]
MRILTAAEMQTMDRLTIDEIGIPGRLLMESAGRGATRCFLERIYRARGRVGVVAGRGNNGGDGFVMARHLAQRDIEVEVFLLASRDRVGGDAQTNLALLQDLGVPVIEMPDDAALAAHQRRMRHIHYWIDAIFGTGLNAEVRDYFRSVIDFINSLNRPVFAVDVPSGLHADTGQPCGICIRAAATATFGFAKIGHVIQAGQSACGVVDIIDIGIPKKVADRSTPRHHLVTGDLVQTILPRRRPDCHKGDTGHALVVAASPGKTGAAAMAATSALRAGAGLVTLGIPQRLNPLLETMVIEAMTLPLPDNSGGALTEAAFDAIVDISKNMRSIAIGPGLGTDPETRALVHRMVRHVPLPMVVDADGLNHLVGHLELLKERDAATILTPHPGEMARLIGTTPARVQADRIGAARDLAVQCRIHVVLKGARTVIADPDGVVWINPTGNPGMASGGMGDVLTGAAAGLLSQGCAPLDAAISAVYLHGLAADLLAADARQGFLATDVMNALPRAIQTALDDPMPPIVNGPWL